MRDTDYSTWQLEPETPRLAQMRELILGYMQTRGASPTYARRMSSYLVEVGLNRTEAYASCVSNGTPERVQTSAATYLGYLQAPDILIKPRQKTPVLKHGDEWRVPFVGERGWKEVLPFYTVTATM